MYDEDIIIAREIQEKKRALNAYNTAGKNVKDFIENSKIFDKINSCSHRNDVDGCRWATTADGNKLTLWYSLRDHDDDRVDFSLLSDGRVFYQGLEIKLSLCDGEEGNPLVLKRLLEALNIFYNSNYAPVSEPEPKPKPKFLHRFFGR